MATAHLELWPGSFVPPASNAATPDPVDGAEFPFGVLRFAQGQLSVVGLMGVNYGSGDLTIDVYWLADTATTGDLVFTARIAAYTPETDTAGLDAATFDSADGVTDPHLGTSARRVHRATITLDSLDGLAAGDLVYMEIARGESGDGDTITGDVLVPLVVVNYSTT